MPLVAEHHFSDLKQTSTHFEVRAPLQALAELALGKRWHNPHKSTDQTTVRLVKWYNTAHATFLAESSKFNRHRKKADLMSHKTAMRQQLTSWLGEKWQCLEVALNDGRIPRIDVLQQVVSRLFLFHA